jgi:hypothetical protein
MSKEDEKKIAEWVGWKDNKYGFFTPPDLNPNAATYPCLPRYTTSNATASVATRLPATGTRRAATTHATNHTCARFPSAASRRERRYTGRDVCHTGRTRHGCCAGSPDDCTGARGDF